MVTTSMRTHGGEVPQAAMRDRADASRTTRQKAPYRGLDDGGGIAAKFPSRLARLGFQNPQAHAWLADRNAIGADGLNLIHAREVENHSAMQGHCLAVVPCSRASRRHWNVVGVAVAQDILNFLNRQRVHDHIRELAIELLAQHRRVPVEVARQAVHYLGSGRHPRRIGQDRGQRHFKRRCHAVWLLLLLIPCGCSRWRRPPASAGG